VTLPEWTASVIAELKGEGFEVSEYQGFPLVKCPETHAEGVRLLKFKTKEFPADRTIYEEGMLFVPAGSRAAADKLARKKDGVS
jgi:hypothetical protein